MIETTACITVDLQSLKEISSSKHFIKGTQGHRDLSCSVWLFHTILYKKHREECDGNEFWSSNWNSKYTFHSPGGMGGRIPAWFELQYFIFVKQTLFINQPLTMHPLKQNNLLTLRKACSHSHHLQRQEYKYVLIKFIFIKMEPSYTISVRKIQDCMKLQLVTPPPCSARALWFVATQSKHGCMGSVGH